MRRYSFFLAVVALLAWSSFSHAGELAFSAPSGLMTWFDWGRDPADLPPGTARLKKGGGVAGHNGLKDVSAKLGPDFWRLRIGIGHPGNRDEVADYVLHPPRQEEAKLISNAVEQSLEVWPLIQTGEMEKAMHRLHTAL
jgi:peptidyl-tRNA hydrolase